jgi:hypothetical protein
MTRLLAWPWDIIRFEFGLCILLAVIPCGFSSASFWGKKCMTKGEVQCTEEELQEVEAETVLVSLKV